MYPGQGYYTEAKDPQIGLFYLSCRFNFGSKLDSRWAPGAAPSILPFTKWVWGSPIHSGHELHPNWLSRGPGTNGTSPLKYFSWLMRCLFEVHQFAGLNGVSAPLTKPAGTDAASVWKVFIWCFPKWDGFACLAGNSKSGKSGIKGDQYEWGQNAMWGAGSWGRWLRTRREECGQGAGSGRPEPGCDCQTGIQDRRKGWTYSRYYFSIHSCLVRTGAQPACMARSQ